MHNSLPIEMTNRIGLHPTWQLLPKTQIYGDVSIGYVTSLETSIKSSSFPLNALG